MDGHKAALYCRLSEEDRDKVCRSAESVSIQNQKAMLLQYAESQGWTVYDIYSDDDYTGADRNRPAFRRLIADAEKGCFDIILCKSQSRFTRELELVETYLHDLFPRWGIRFVGLADNADTSNRGNKKARQINGLVNEWYLEDMSESIKSVLDSRRKNGFHIGSFALYGYRKDPEHRGRLLIDEEAAQVVREIFSRFAQGYGKTAIARSLNDRGIPNPTAYKRLHGLRYTQPNGTYGSLWRYSTIAHMLTNELYIGNMVQGRYGSVSYKTKENRPRPKSAWFRVEHTHPAIIQPALWEAVQTRLAQKARPFPNGMVGVFAGKCRCMSCGYTLRSSKSRGKRYLQCPSRCVSPNACVGAFLSQETLEALVLAELHRLADTCLDWETLVRCADPRPALEKQATQLQRRLDDCRKALERCGQAARTLYLDRAKGLLSLPDYESLRQALDQEQKELEQQAEGLCSQQAALTAQLCQPPDLHALTHPRRLTREMADLFLESVSVGRDHARPRHTLVELSWRF